MTLTYKHTRLACRIGSVTQGINNNYVPLLFVAFSTRFGIDLPLISLLIVLNFGTQIIVDTASVAFVDKVGFRACAVACHVSTALGLIGLGTLPFILPPYAGIAISVVVCAIGGGLAEVVISPILEALPDDNKAANMSLLHSFYCWGQLGVVLLSTLFFAVFGVENWHILAIIWSLVPIFNTVLFTRVPIFTLVEPEHKTRVSAMLTSPLFLLFFLVMISAGAAEQVMSQWASYFAESALHVTKTAGDLMGLSAFALLMGCSRVMFAFLEKKYDLRLLLSLSSVLCVGTYLVASLSPFPVLALVGCAVCGFSVGMMWPGTLSLASSRFKNGGGSLFAALAIGGDVGCTAGPWLVGMLANATGRLQNGLLFAIVFPVIMLAACIRLKNKSSQ